MTVQGERELEESPASASSGSSPLERVLGPVVGAYREVLESPRAGAPGRDYRKRLLLLLSLAIALDFADRSAVGALGPQLKSEFGLSNTSFGVVASAYSIVAAVATLPAGVLVDRMRRTLVLATGIVLWSIAMGVTGLAFGFAMLVGARVFLGVVTAAARPAVASMTGDVFATRVRGRALGLIDSGELVGDGAGYLVAAAAVAVLSWRAGFWALGLLGLVLAWFVWRLPEPPRCGSDRDEEDARGDVAHRIAQESDEIEPDERLVLHGDQAEMPLPEAVHYTLGIRTNVIVIVAMAISTFFFSGVRAFGIVYIVEDYGVSHGAATLALLAVGAGALVGVVAGGRIGDWLIRRGMLNGRIVVSSFSYLFCVAAFAPAFLLHSFWGSLPLFMLGAAGLAAPTAPLDAVRLDVVHPQLWGRAEGIRNVLQIVAQAAAPLLFGLVADELGTGRGRGLRLTFLIALGSVIAAGMLLQLAKRTYPPELAAAGASRQGASEG